jgi:predicted ATP-dependent protease
MNQHGQAQPIGGVNEKIEGFFDVCSAHGLTGEQGVIIPSSNARHLMLRQNVVSAVAAGKFHVWTVASVDEALALLLGREPGARGADGRFPEGTINALVDAQLQRFAESRQRFAPGERAGH